MTLIAVADMAPLGIAWFEIDSHMLVAAAVDMVAVLAAVGKNHMEVVHFEEMAVVLLVEHTLVEVALAVENRVADLAFGLAAAVVVEEDTVDLKKIVEDIVGRMRKEVSRASGRRHHMQQHAWAEEGRTLDLDSL